MLIPEDVVKAIAVILFDMNGTLRGQEAHLPTQSAAAARLVELLGLQSVPEGFWETLTQRYSAYGHWAQTNLLQLSEKEIWSSWLLPDVPRAKIEPVAAELSLAWKERKGRPVPRPGAEQTLTELKRRGYRLGVISNSFSSLDIPRCLAEFGWQEIFEVVILSAFSKSRKPSPEMFLEAARTMQVLPAHCAYIGNRISRDVVGCKRAGFALGLIVEPDGKPRADEQDQPISPDGTIHVLGELLDLFPLRAITVPED